jgi:hypothetical protein
MESFLQCNGSGAFLTPGSGIRKRFFPDPRYQTHIFESLVNYNKFFSPLSIVAVLGPGIRDPGSGMGKDQGPGFGIKIPDPQHWFSLDIVKVKVTYSRNRSGKNLFNLAGRISGAPIGGGGAP